MAGFDDASTREVVEDSGELELRRMIANGEMRTFLIADENGDPAIVLVHVDDVPDFLSDYGTHIQGGVSDE